MAMERAQSFIGRARGDPSDKPLFEGVKFYLGPLLDRNLQYSVYISFLLQIGFFTFLMSDDIA